MVLCIWLELPPEASHTVLSCIQKEYKVWTTQILNLQIIIYAYGSYKQEFTTKKCEIDTEHSAKIGYLI